MNEGLLRSPAGASSLATRFVLGTRIPGHTTKPCGSELARDDGSTASITGTDPPLSRASSLPQWVKGVGNSWSHHQTLWERACSR
jgi:hypothetical protein